MQGTRETSNPVPIEYIRTPQQYENNIYLTKIYWEQDRRSESMEKAFDFKVCSGIQGQHRCTYERIHDFYDFLLCVEAMLLHNAESRQTNRKDRKRKQNLMGRACYLLSIFHCFFFLSKKGFRCSRQSYSYVKACGLYVWY